MRAHSIEIPGIVRTEVFMGTLVTIQVLSSGASEAVEQAFGWFREIESRCTRFDPQSELMQLTAQAGRPVSVSAVLFEAVQFALAIAEDSEGAFDPAVGRAMELRGFNREHRTGEAIHTAIPDAAVSYRDVELDAERRTILLRQPLVLDLGSVAKGLAVDMAARELQPFTDFAIDAGGDLYLGGHNPHGEPWSVGIRHPREDQQLIDSFRLSNQAVCTSGDYERGGPHANGRHILNPRGVRDARSGPMAASVASATVIAPAAMAADALATAAFVLGPAEGIAFLERVGVEGLIVTPELARYETAGLCHVR